MKRVYILVEMITFVRIANGVILLILLLVVGGVLVGFRVWRSFKGLKLDVRILRAPFCLDYYTEWEFDLCRILRVY